MIHELSGLERDKTLSTSKDIEILLWDQHRTEREVIKEMLAKLGCHVTAVREEDECLTKFRGGKYDLVIFDQGLPDLDINEFLDDLAEIDQLTPVAMLATLDFEYYETRYGDSNIDFIIVKPFEFIQLQELVKEATELGERVKGSG